MASGTIEKLTTADEFVEIAERLDGRCELVRGEVREMTRPTFRHGAVCARISLRLGNWSESGLHGTVVTNDAGLFTQRDPDSVRGPDLCYISNARLPGGEWPNAWLETPPEICVEVLSDSDRWKDVFEKVTEYFAFGVLEVWVADPNSKQIHIYQPDSPPRVLGVDSLLTSLILPGFECRISEIFAGC